MALSHQVDEGFVDAQLRLSTLWACNSPTSVNQSVGIEDKELLVADGSCPHIRELLATCRVPVLWLTDQHDPLIVVGEVLAQKREQGRPVERLHWISHGAPGAVFVGDQTLNTTALLNAQQALATWQVKTINLWSCSTGADQDFVSVFEELSGASIWASPGILGRQADGSRHWRLSNASTRDKPDFPINQHQLLTWNYQLAGFSSNTTNPKASPGRTFKESRNQSAFAALKDDGSVITWGALSYGGSSSSVSSSLSSGVSQIFSNGYAFAALKEDGSVITWGANYAGGNSSSFSSSLTSGVSQIFSTFSAFAALKDDGSVITWGRSYAGGSSSSVASSLSSGVSQIFSTNSAFAALKDDGSVITWGQSNYGSNSSSVASSLSSGVSQIFSTNSAFAALKDDGSVITWGGSSNGGNSSSVSSSLSSGVSQIFSTAYAFAALKDDGSVITWGGSSHGGNSSSVSSSLSSGVSQIFSTRYAFAALKDDGSIITWGDSNRGGNSSSVSSSLSSGVSQIFSTGSAFAALKDDGSVITWGQSNYGSNSSSVASSLSSGVSQIFSTNSAFAALKDDGSVITWGDSNNGGNSSSVSSSLSSGVSQIFSTNSAFAALKNDGSVITWGALAYGGNSSSVASSLSSGVVGFANPFTNDVYDTIAPSFSSAATNTDGTKVVLTYNEALSATTAAISDFAVTTDGAANAVTAVAISGSTVELSLTNTVRNDQAVTVTYTDPSGSDDSNAVQDLARIDAATLSSRSVTNNSTVAGTPPTFSSAATSTDGTKVVLTYNEALSANTAAASAFTVTSGGVANAVTGVGVSGSTVELTVTRPIPSWHAISVSYTDPSDSNDSNVVQDSQGNDAASLSTTAVTNSSTQPFEQRGSDIDGEAANDYSGRSVSLSSDGTIVAITSHGGNKTRVFQRNSETNAWIQMGSDFVGPTGVSWGAGSVSLSSDGTIFALGNPGGNKTRIFQWDAGSSAWNQLGSDIDGKTACDESGFSVSLSSDGSVIAIGNPGVGSCSQNKKRGGRARIYDWNSLTNDWIQRGSDISNHSRGKSHLLVSRAGAGNSVSLSSDGNVVAVGASNTGRQGYTQIFAWDGSAWEQRGGPIDGDTWGDGSGNSVSLSSDGSIVAIGAPNHPGKTQIHEWNGSAWEQRGADIVGKGTRDQSGHSVSLSGDGNLVAIGAPGTHSPTDNQGYSRLYQWDASSSAWNELGTEIDGEEAYDRSGWAISLSKDGSTVAVGAFYNDGNGDQAGHVRVYNLDNTAPTIAVSSDVSSLKAGETATLSFTLSDASTDFVQSDISVSGGALSNFSGSGTSYSATFTPTADSTSNGVISVGSSKFSETSGNFNADGSDPNNSVTLSVDTIRPTISVAINDGGDGSLNAAEDGSVAIAGTTSGAEDGQTVAINISSSAGGTPINTTATTNSNSYSVTGLDLSSLNDGTISITADVSDLAGNAATQASDTSTKDTAAPTISVAINDSGDGLLNAAEDGSVDISGTTSGAEDGQTVAINISSSAGGTPINTTASTNSNSYSVTGLDLSSLNDGTISITADVSDLAGNAATQASDTSTKDTAAPTISVAINDGGDGRLNAAEDGSVDISGTTSGAEDGQTVAINISSSAGGTPINTTATTNSNSYSVTGLDLSSVNDGTLTITADVSDLAGNSATQASDTSTKDSTAPNISVAINDGGDGSLNAAEDGSVAIAGTTSGAEDGQTVAINISSSAGGTPINTTASVNSNSYSRSNLDLSSLNDGTISITADVSDLAGNAATQASDTSTKDTAAPTITISSDVASLKAGETASLGFTLSESTTDFVQSDVSVSGGALSNFSGSGTAYSSTFTPSANSTSDGLISVASAKFSDSAGNTNNDGSDANNAVSLSVDTVRPSFSSAATSTDGAKVVLSYDETLSSTTAPTSAFAVTTDGAANAVTAVSNDGATSELTLTNTIKANQAVTVAYNDPSSSDDANAVQDSAGNDAVSFSSTTVTNNSTIPAASTGGSDLIPNTPTTSKLLLSNENSFSVTKSAAQGLWINLKVISADSDLQNSLIIVDQNNNALGCIGATHSSGNCGDHAIFMPHGSTISFHQFSNNQPLISSPQLDITDNNDGSFQLRLNDRLNDSDHDDLVVDISHSASSPNPAATAMAAKQQGIHNAVLDLSSIPATGQTLKLSLNSNCAFVNRIAMVKLSEDADGNFSVDGITNTAGAAFDQAVADNLINPGGDSISCTGVETQAIEWDLSASDAGLYAPVLITPDGEIYTYGSSQIKALGCNFFAFEDDNSQNSSDWDFNDLSIKFEII